MSSSRCSGRRWCSRTTRRWRRSCTASFASFFPQERGRVLRFVLRLLPARGLRALERHLHREGFLDQRAHRADALVGDQGAAGAAGLHHRRDGVGDLRFGRSRRVPRHGAAHGRAAIGWINAGCCGASPTCSTRATRSTCRRAPIACAAMSSTSFRRNRSARRCASNSSTRRSSRSPSSIRSPGRSIARCRATPYIRVLTT